MEHAGVFPLEKYLGKGRADFRVEPRNADIIAKWNAKMEFVQAAVLYLESKPIADWGDLEDPSPEKIRSLAGYER